MISTDLKSYFAKTRVLGQGGDRISLSESEIAWLLCLSAADLGLKLANPGLKAEGKKLPGFYEGGVPPLLPKSWVVPPVFWTVS